MVVLVLLLLRRSNPFGWLKAAEQWQLHDFFQPSKSLTDSDLAAPRRQITKERPALPQQAGRAFAKLHRIAETSRTEGGVTVHRRIVVYGVVNPEIDVEQFVQAC